LSQPLAAGQSRPPSLLYLIDTSALARVRDEAVRNIVAGLLATRLAATAVTVDLEAGYSGRDLADVKAIAELRQSKYVVLPVTETIAQRAREVQVLMAARGHHRAAGAIDLLTAAIAEHHGAVIMHYDADFEHIAAVTGQLHRWILPRGSIPEPDGRDVGFLPYAVKRLRPGCALRDAAVPGGHGLGNPSGRVGRVRPARPCNVAVWPDQQRVRRPGL